MGKIAKKLFMKNAAGVTQSVLIFDSSSDVPSPYLRLNIDKVQAYVPLVSVGHVRASIGRVKRADGSVWAVGSWYYPVSASLPALQNDTTKTKSYSNVAVGSEVTAVYQLTNNVWDSSDYTTISWEGLSLVSTSGGSVSGNTCNLGPNSGTYTLKFTATAASITFNIWGHGNTSCTGTLTYYSDK